ncbi:unnamed protein product, partial [Amoebophrya sp. A120]|eukprot:GSA120T00023569001.1
MNMNLHSGYCNTEGKKNHGQLSRGVVQRSTRVQEGNEARQIKMPIKSCAITAATRTSSRGQLHDTTTV